MQISVHASGPGSGPASPYLWCPREMKEVSLEVAPQGIFPARLNSSGTDSAPHGLRLPKAARPPIDLETGTDWDAPVGTDIDRGVLSGPGGEDMAGTSVGPPCVRAAGAEGPNGAGELAGVERSEPGDARGRRR